MRTARDIGQLIELATRQAGRVTRAQLNRCGVGNTTIARWVRNGRLIQTLPRVYALGYAARTQESRLWEAVLYAGPGAMLSHLTAAQWRGYIKYAPQAIHVSTPRKANSLPSVVVHGRRPQLARDNHEGIPVTDQAQTLLDLATVRPDLLKRALGQLEYLESYELARLQAATDGGKPGCAALRSALTTYDPNFARLNDEFEIDFYECCRAWGIDPLPIPNVEVTPGLTVDALWPEHHLGVELDGRQNHHSAGQLLRDADRDLVCRGLGLTIIRYRRAQIRRTPERVRADLETQLRLRATQPVGPCQLNPTGVSSGGRTG